MEEHLIKFKKKTYSPTKMRQQAVSGFSIMCIGFAVQFIFEKFLWAAPKPEVAVYIIGLPFCTGGLIFGHALLTTLVRNPQRPLHFKEKDVHATYQANMIKLRQRLKVSVLTTISGFVCFAFFVSNQGQLFFIGAPVALIGVLMIVFSYNRYARCPACKHLPTNKTGKGVSTNLQNCPNCGAKLG